MEETHSRKVVLRLGFEISVDEMIEILEEDMSSAMVKSLEGKGSEVRLYEQRYRWTSYVYIEAKRFELWSTQYIYQAASYERPVSTACIFKKVQKSCIYPANAAENTA